MTIQYQIKPQNPNAHLFNVVLSVSTPDPDGQSFSLPNWIPGSYMIRDYSKNIVEIQAFAGGQKVALEKTGKSSWKSAPGLLELELRYSVYAWDLSVRAAHLDAHHGFFNGTSVFIEATGFEGQPIQLEILRPDGDAYKAWKVASSLNADEVDDQGFGKYTVADYDELLDHPVEMGEFTRVSFDACGVVHDVVLTGRFDADLDRICADLKTICEYHMHFFGLPAPVDKYVFLVMVVGNGYGGLEHRASTSLLVSRKNLPAKGVVVTNDDYLDFLGLCSHEYFHTWNVKRIKPAAFVPYKLESEVYTRLLWAFEGITSYYDDLALVRCGLIDEKRYLKLVGKTITRVYRGAGRLKQSTGDSSFDAWNKFYKQDENAPNAIVSYYAKGSLIALCLDAEMQFRSNRKVGLDDLMQRLWTDWKETQKGLEEQQIEEIVTELVGESMSDFFNLAIRSTTDLPLEKALKKFGVDICWRAANSAADAGGDAASEAPIKPATGMRWKAHPKGIELTHVLDDGAAQLGGLSAGDIITAIDGYAVDSEGMELYLSRTQSGQALNVYFFRHLELHNVEIVLQKPAKDTCYLLPAVESEAAFNTWLSPSAASKVSNMKSDELSSALILQNFSTGAESVDVEVFDELPSTNRYLSERAKESNKQRSRLVVADSQSAGVGRRGKSWVSEAGNISMSLLSHFDVPPNQLMGLSLVTGVTVASVLRGSARVDCQLKWPNDILISGAKLAGLLIEIPQSTATSCSVITGIGINFRSIGAGANIEQQTASLATADVLLNRNELIGIIASGLLHNYSTYCQHGLAAFASGWDELDYLKGKPVTVFLHDQNVEGVALGIATSGELLVNLNGTVRSFNSGEVSVRRR